MHRIHVARLALALALLPLPAAAQGSAPPAVAPGSSSSATPAPERDRTYTFQLVLLAAEAQGTPRFDNVPANAQKALDDVRDFLPYKSYRLLDLAWLRSSRSAEAQLSGLDGATLSAQIRFLSPPGEPGRIDIQRFVIVDTPTVPVLLEAPRTDGAPTATAPRPLRPLLETSFGMKVGETVVVGTAKLDGPSKALVVILSAIP